MVWSREWSAADVVLLVLAAAVSTTVAGQGLDAIDAIGGPFTGPPVLDAPCSADATTTLTQSPGTVAGPTRNRKARYYRDSAGRTHHRLTTALQRRGRVH